MRGVFLAVVLGLAAACQPSGSGLGDGGPVGDAGSVWMSPPGGQPVYGSWDGGDCWDTPCPWGEHCSLATNDCVPEPSAGPRPFSTPVTDPGAQWKVPADLWAGFGGWHLADLDGPRLEAMSYAALSPDPFFEDGARWSLRSYSSGLDRFFTAAGGAPGILDGPFSRARFSGWGYVGGAFASTSDGHYAYFVDGSNGSVRRFDFGRQVVEPVATVPPGAVGIAASDVDGSLYIASFGLADHVEHVGVDGSVENIPIDGLSVTASHDSLTAITQAAFDPKQQRLYGFMRGCGTSGPSNGTDPNGWVLWYWDLAAGGHFVGLIPQTSNPANGTARTQMATGPFIGSCFWCSNDIAFGPDDPDYRYLYMGGGDEGTMYRLDLQQQYWVKLCPIAGSTDLVHFADSPGQTHLFGYDGAAGIFWRHEDVDDLFAGYRGYSYRFQRVQ